MSHTAPSDAIVVEKATHLDEGQLALARGWLQHLLEVERMRVEQMAADGLPPSAAHDHLQMAATIEVAMAKIDAGTYGLCESCQEPIPFERLEAMPYANACVACQQRPRTRF